MTDQRHRYRYSVAGIMVPVMSESTSGARLAEPPTREPVARRGHRRDLIAVALALLLVGAPTAVGLYFNRPGSGVIIYAFAPPLFGEWLPHVGPGSLFAVLTAVAVVGWAPAVAARWPWRRVLALGYLVSLCWTFALALVDGWSRGFALRLTQPTE